MSEEEIVIYALKGWVPYVRKDTEIQFLRNINDKRYFWMSGYMVRSPAFRDDWDGGMDLDTYQRISWKDLDDLFLQNFKATIKDK